MRPRGWASRTGAAAPDVLVLLGEGTRDPPIPRPRQSRVGRSGVSRQLAPGAPRATTWSAWRGPLARVPRRLRSRGASYLLCSSSSARSQGPPVGASVLPSTSPRAASLHGRPAGPAPRGACPAPGARRTSRSAQGKWGLGGCEPPGLGGAGRGQGGEGARTQGARRRVPSGLRAARRARGAQGASLRGRGRGQRPGQRAVLRPLLAPSSARAALWSPRRCPCRRCRRCPSAPS